MMHSSRREYLGHIELDWWQPNFLGKFLPTLRENYASWLKPDIGEVQYFGMEKFNCCISPHHPRPHRSREAQKNPVCGFWYRLKRLDPPAAAKERSLEW
jgi:hypothetical protein